MRTVRALRIYVSVNSQLRDTTSVAIGYRLGSKASLIRA